jgi:hypothetical protein
MMPLTLSRIQMSAYSFESATPIIIRALSFHFAVGKMKTAICHDCFEINFSQCVQMITIAIVSRRQY